MALTVYRSTDVSAPSMNSDAGSLIAVLDACLVNGYGSKTAAGWTKPYSGTNLAAYQQGVGGKNMLLRIDDTNSTYAQAVGYETMSDVNTGSGAFPTAAQRAAGMYWLKSNNATNREWIVIADSKRFWFATSWSANTFYANADGCSFGFFGNFDSFLAGDAYNVCLAGNIGTTIASNSLNAFVTYDWATPSANAAVYAARSLTQTGQAVPMYLASDGSVGRTSGFSNNATYPDAATGGMRIARVSLHESSGRLARGTLPGYWGIAHYRPGQSGDTFSGAGALSSRAFILLNNRGALDGALGRSALEISDTWG